MDSLSISRPAVYLPFPPVRRFTTPYNVSNEQICSQGLTKERVIRVSMVCIIIGVNTGFKELKEIVYRPCDVNSEQRAIWGRGWSRGELQA